MGIRQEDEDELAAAFEQWTKNHGVVWFADDRRLAEAIATALGIDLVWDQRDPARAGGFLMSERYEDTLRERPESLLAQGPPAIPVATEERDALADAIEALRAIHSESELQRTLSPAEPGSAPYREAWLHAGQGLGLIFDRLDSFVSAGRVAGDER